METVGDRGFRLTGDEWGKCVVQKTKEFLKHAAIAIAYIGNSNGDPKSPLYSGAMLIFPDQESTANFEEFCNTLVPPVMVATTNSPTKSA